MPPKGHAVLSASSSDRWLHCPPSARLSENYPDHGSDYAAEGTDAHALCEYKLKCALGRPAKDPVPNLTWYNAEMEECAEQYVAYVWELVEEAKGHCSDPVVLIEQKVDFSRWVPHGFGTADCIIIADSLLNVVDYKHGQGVEVSAVDNPQMKLYALGALEIFDVLYDIDTVQMSIFQPRKANVSVFRMPKDDLLEWADTELSKKAKLAANGQGDFSCGEWCRFCKARADCRERARYNLELAKYEFASPALLEDSEIADILGRIDSLTEWASDVKEYALQQAITGKEWSGWKLVEGRSNRRYTDENAVIQAAHTAGYTDIFRKSLIPITEMEKLMGKTAFVEILGKLVTKPHGKPTLVPASDRRPAIAITNAKADFNDYKGD